MANNTFYSVDNANKQDLLAMSENPSPKRSVFPYGCSTVKTINEGGIYPVDLVRVLPGDSMDIDIALALQVLNPFVTRQFSGMKATVHVFYQKDEHEWRGFKNFATQGRRGNIVLQQPWVNPSGNYTFTDSGTTYNTTPIYLWDSYVLKSSNAGTDTPVTCKHDTLESLIAYLADFPITASRNDSVTGVGTYSVNGTTVTLGDVGLGDSTQVNRCFWASSDPISTTRKFLIPSANLGNLKFYAVPFATYQRNYRDFYLNKNLVQNNPLWFPNDDEEFQLPYAGGHVNCLSDKYPQNQAYSVVPNNSTNIMPQKPNSTSIGSISYTTKYADAPILTALRYRQRNGDPFTTGLPFLERGGVTEQFLQVFNSADTYINSTSTYTGQIDGYLYKGMPEVTSGTFADQALQSRPLSSSNLPERAQIRWKTDHSNLGVFQTMNKLRELAVMTLWSEKNARTDGDYNSLIRAHYGVDPKSQDRSARYLGGTQLRLDFDLITQTSESGNTPLGQQTSRAYGNGSASLGHFEFHDFGFLHFYVSLVPDTFYSQGLPSWFDSSLSGVDLPFPEFTSLPRASVPKSRIYYDGSATDKQLLNYQERFLEYKYRFNRLGGHMLDKEDANFRAMTFGRYFDSAPEFNNDFVSMAPYAMRDDMYAVPKQPHWICSFADSIRLVRCLPYMNKEANLVI